MKYYQTFGMMKVVTRTMIAMIAGFGFILFPLSCQAKTKIKVGDKAPAINLEDHNGKIIKLEDFKDKELVLIAFYPKDGSKVCTVEMKNFAADYEQFTGINAQIIGISGDSPESHGEFISKNGLQFVLLSDKKHEVSKAYGAYNKLLKVSERAYFIVDREGIVRYADVKKSLAAREDNEVLLKAMKDIIASDKIKSK